MGFTNQKGVKATIPFGMNQVPAMWLSAGSRGGKTTLISNVLLSMFRNSDGTLQVTAFDAKHGAEFLDCIRPFTKIVDVPSDVKKAKNQAEKLKREILERAAYKNSVNAKTMNEAWLKGLAGSEKYQPHVVVFDEWPVISNLKGSKEDEEASEAILELCRKLLGMGSALGYVVFILSQTGRMESMKALGGMVDNISVRIYGFQ
ncbi:MAG: hypothetical protein EOO46_05980, partial [Flavobacterium sp.]